jgi:CubicO group peptidase (beta-lactamase class C family)
MNCRQVLFALSLSALPLLAQEQALRFRRAYDRIDRIAERIMRESKVPGMALAITSRDGLLHVSTYGFANSDAREPVTPDTLFGLGSIGKSFTAVAVLALHDAGKLNLRAPVQDYLPWFKVNSTGPISLHHLLTHTSGFPSMRMELTSTVYQAYWLTEAPLKFEPGKQYHYSSSAFDVLSLVVAAVAQKSYAQFVRVAILEPLEMHQSEPVFTNRMRPRLAVSYEPLYDDRPSRPEYPMVTSNWYEYGGGAGSVAASATDLAAYVRMLLNRGRGPHKQILTEESFTLLTQRAVPRGQNRYYGYGLEISDEGGHTLIGHGGGQQGFRSMMIGDLDDGLGVGIVCNAPANLDFARFALKAVQAALHNHELPQLPSPDQPSSVVDASNYSGSYTTTEGKQFSVRAEKDGLILTYNGQASPLERQGKDAFLCGHPDFSLFPLRFGRNEGSVVEASYGSEWYINARYGGPKQFDYPSEWNAYPGHYRISSRHHINFRIALRKENLWLINPGGDETELVPLQAGLFRLGDSPEWLRFDTVVLGECLRVNYSGTDFHRDFTP